MDIAVITLEGIEAGTVTLPDDVFGLEPRADILARCVRWQLAKRRAGTHKTKGRAEIARTGKKLYKQKGSGNARHGSARVPQFRGGGRAFGPVVRSHEHDLPKKVRALALRHALSTKAKAGTLIIIDQASVPEAKTKSLLDCFGRIGLVNALVIAGVQVETNFGLAARNIPNVDVLPIQGLNVYDILRRDTLVLTRVALAAILARFAPVTQEVAA